MQFVKGPDFPTGGSILGRAGIIDAYRTGRGSIRMRAAAEIEEVKNGIADRRDRAAVPDLRDSDRGAHRRAGQRPQTSRAFARSTTSRPVTAPASSSSLKRDANANVVLNNLYKHTPMQTSFAINMVALVDGVPRTLNLVSGAERVCRPPDRGHHPAVGVPAPQGP